VTSFATLSTAAGSLSLLSVMLTACVKPVCRKRRRGITTAASGIFRGNLCSGVKEKAASAMGKAGSG
jgi:hypothetical protein